MRRSVLLTSLTLLGVLVLAACGGDDGGAQTTTTTTMADQATTTTTRAPTGPVEIPDFPFPVPDGATRVLASEEGFLELEYPGADAEQIAAFYQQWTTEQGSWTAYEVDSEPGVIASFFDDNQNGIDILRETPETETIVILSALGG
ncbi:MAG: hypothetical protein ACR2OI_02855 [Acidimicrobiia bacterium]